LNYYFHLIGLINVSGIYFMTEKKAIMPFSDFVVNDGVKIAVMAPHPDDFDAIGVTLKRIARAGALINLAVLTGGASGVEDSFGSFTCDADKARLRESEQLDSCRLFGLQEQTVTFLRLQEDAEGTPLDCSDNYKIIFDYLSQLVPDIIFMPHNNDTNAGHQVCFKLVKNVIDKLALKVPLMLNMDPKTVEMQPDYYSGFDNGEADWKGALLRCHKSQHQRNLNTRQHGFDFRILEFNRQCAAKFELPATFAELFECIII
jgi:LmbE family N-acetylglucosaminyl deacetylase